MYQYYYTLALQILEIYIHIQLDNSGANPSPSKGSLPPSVWVRVCVCGIGCLQNLIGGDVHHESSSLAWARRSANRTTLLLDLEDRAIDTQGMCLLIF